MPRSAKVDQELNLDIKNIQLPDFIERMGNDWKAPYHLGEYLEIMSHLDQGSVRICVAMPPQHSKTTTCLCAIVLCLLKNPKLKIAYASHGQKFSEEQSRVAREMFQYCGGQIKSDFNRIDHWQTEDGGGFVATSWEGSLIGKRVDIMICDDLIKDAKMAESPEQREHIARWIDGVMTQRLWVGGSVIVIGSRWHPDDPSGRLIARGYREICLPAIREDEDGNEHALWPEVKSLEWLNTLRLPSSPDYVGDHAWNAAYQGKPVPRTGSLFGPARYYDELPPGAEIVSIGVDIATSASRRSDWTSGVVLAHLDGIYYVHDVRRVQQVIIEVEREMKELIADYPAARMCSYVAGQERGIFDLLFYRGLEVDRLPATQSKWTRSQRCALAWKTGRILIRKGQQWTAKFVREVEYFTGEDGAYDDQVDALVSGFDAHAASAPIGWAGGGFKFGKAVM